MRRIGLHLFVRMFAFSSAVQTADPARQLLANFVAGFMLVFGM